MARKRFYNTGRPIYGRKSFDSTTVTMGKVFRTRAGRVGCYVYINGRRSHFEEKRYGGQDSTRVYYNSKRK